MQVSGKVWGEQYLVGALVLAMQCWALWSSRHVNCEWSGYLVISGGLGTKNPQ